MKKNTAKTTQYMCTKPGITKIYNTTINTKKEKLTKYNYSGEPEYPIDSSGQVIQSENELENLAVNDTLYQEHIVNIFRAFHHKTKNIYFFLSARGTFSRVDHLFCHKTSLNKFHKTEIMPTIFSGTWKLTTRRKLEKPQICAD